MSCFNCDLLLLVIDLVDFDINDINLKIELKIYLFFIVI